jgi:hypothetical protein
MDTSINHEGICLNLEMYEPPVEIKDRGWVHFATLTKSTTRQELGKLLTLTLWGEKVSGVESFAIEQQNRGQKIGLLLSKKLWSGK